MGLGAYVSFFYGPEPQIHSTSVQAAPSLEQAIAAADAMAGHHSTAADWRALRKIDGTKPRSELDPPPVTMHRRQCPQCPEYRDSLRWKATKRLPLELLEGWECDGPQDNARCRGSREYRRLGPALRSAAASHPTGTR